MRYLVVGLIGDILILDELLVLKIDSADDDVEGQRRQKHEGHDTLGHREDEHRTWRRNQAFTSIKTQLRTLIKS